jgi:hypothetical protein
LNVKKSEARTSAIKFGQKNSKKNICGGGQAIC